MGYSREQMTAREQQILDFAEIGDFIDAPVKQYSSGMQVRLAFAVATEVDPNVLIVDEVLAVGDASFQRKCFDRIRNFRESGKTILFVSHNMQQVIDHCDRAVLLDQGRVVSDGQPLNVCAQYKDLC